MIRKATIALTRNELYERVWLQPLSTVAAAVGLSPNALTKICDRLLVPYPSRGYWTRAVPSRDKVRPALPPAPDNASKHLTISSERSQSRRTRSRLSPLIRRQQLIAVAEQIILAEGLSATTLKRIAATAGISETQVYNYFGTREKLFVELARREFARIREAREQESVRAHDHYTRIMLTTRIYLRQIGLRGALLQRLLSHPGVRDMLRAEHREQSSNDLHSHAKGLVDLYGVSRSLALGTTVVLTSLCLRAGKIIADKRIPLEAAERLCLAMLLQGSRDVVLGQGDAVR